MTERDMDDTVDERAQEGDVSPSTLKKQMNEKESFDEARRVVENLIGDINRYLELDPNSAQSDRDAVFSAGLSDILRFRQTHRELCELVEGLREKTALVKSELDVSSLHLQNLLYVKHHYQREIQACRSYKSAFTDEDLEMISEDQFRAIQASEKHANDEVKGEENESNMDGEVEEGEQVMEVEDGEQADDELGIDTKMEEGDNGEDNGGHVENIEDEAHAFMLERLRYEVSRRQVTLQELAALKSERDSVAADLAKERNILTTIDLEVGKLKSSVLHSLQTFEGEENSPDPKLNYLAEEFVPNI
jgi:hypothetical protein